MLQGEKAKSYIQVDLFKLHKHLSGNTKSQKDLGNYIVESKILQMLSSLYSAKISLIIDEKKPRYSVLNSNLNNIFPEFH